MLPSPVNTRTFSSQLGSPIHLVKCHVTHKNLNRSTFSLQCAHSEFAALSAEHRINLFTMGRFFQRTFTLALHACNFLQIPPCVQLSIHPTHAHYNCFLHCSYTHTHNTVQVPSASGACMNAPRAHAALPRPESTRGLTAPLPPSRAHVWRPGSAPADATWAAGLAKAPHLIVHPGRAGRLGAAPAAGGCGGGGKRERRRSRLGQARPERETQGSDPARAHRKRLPVPASSDASPRRARARGGNGHAPQAACAGPPSAQAQPRSRRRPFLRRGVAAASSAHRGKRKEPRQHFRLRPGSTRSAFCSG